MMTQEERYGANWREQIEGFRVVRFGCPRYEDIVLVKQKNGYRTTRVALSMGQIEPGQSYLILQRSNDSQLRAKAA